MKKRVVRGFCRGENMFVVRWMGQVNLFLDKVFLTPIFAIFRDRWISLSVLGTNLKLMHFLTNQIC
jgi:hypothetical protein